jgi:hypothetical protein
VAACFATAADLTSRGYEFNVLKGLCAGGQSRKLSPQGEINYDKALLFHIHFPVVTYFFPTLLGGR